MMLAKRISLREETTNLTRGIQKPKLSNMDTVALAVNQLPLGQDQQNLKIIGGHVIILIIILPDMIMEEIMNSRDQDHLMHRVKIVDTKILDNLMIKEEATVKILDTMILDNLMIKEATVKKGIKMTVDHTVKKDLTARIEDIMMTRAVIVFKPEAEIPRKFAVTKPEIIKVNRQKTRQITTVVPVAAATPHLLHLHHRHLHLKES